MRYDEIPKRQIWKWIYALRWWPNHGLSLFFNALFSLHRSFCHWQSYCFCQFLSKCQAFKNKHSTYLHSMFHQTRKKKLPTKWSANSTKLEKHAEACCISRLPAWAEVHLLLLFGSRPRLTVNHLTVKRRTPRIEGHRMPQWWDNLLKCIEAASSRQRLAACSFS